MKADPFDAVRALGVRVVAMEDFDDLVWFAEDIDVVLFDVALDPKAAARSALSIILEGDRVDHE